MFQKNKADIVLQHTDSPPSNVEPVVAMHGVNHYFGQADVRTQVLYNINLELVPGQIVFLMGPSGCGKTTLLTLIGALRSLQEGSIRVLGKELLGMSPRQQVETRRHIGFIFQDHNLFESLTAHRNVKMALELHTGNAADNSQRAEEILRQLDLGDRIYYKPEFLSGGQKQRVAIARALVHQPKLVLADEPTAALDGKSAVTVMNLLKSLTADHGCTVLMVTHDEKTLDFADRIVKMQQGHVVSDVVVEESISICAFLRECRIFHDLTPNTLSEIADRVIRQVRPAGEVIVRQGDVGAEFFVVRSGSADVYKEDGAGRHVVATLKETDHFGEAALLTGEPRNATVVARENTELYTLNKRDFQAAIDHQLSLREELLHVFSARH